MHKVDVKASNYKPCEFKLIAPSTFGPRWPTIVSSGLLISLLIVACGGKAVDNSGSPTTNGGSGLPGQGGASNLGAGGQATSYATSAVAIDLSDIWHGGGNAVQTGGYWFSYTDHVQWMINNTGWDPATHTPNSGAAIAPLTSLTVSMPMAQDPAAPEHGDVIQVTGFTPAPPSWADVVRAQGANPGGWFDTYYQQAAEYPNSLIAAYPVAGVGFGFKHDNAQFDPSFGGMYVGVTFDMKTQGNTVSVDAQLAVVCDANNGDDLNDPFFSDAFPAPGCKYSQMTTLGEDLAAQGADYAAQQANNTCSLCEHKLFTYLPDNQWNTYCFLWNELALPDWAGPTATPPVWNDQTLQRCTTKLKWEMDKTSTEGTRSYFNVMLDNIKLITRAQAADPAWNCNVSALPTDSSRLIGPAPGTAGG